MRTPLALILLLTTAANAADVIITFEGLDRGTGVTLENFWSSIQGNTNGVTLVASGDYTRMDYQSGTNAFFSPLTINGVSYTGAGSNILRYTWATGGSESVNIYLPGGAGGTITNVVVSCFLRLNADPDNPQANYDPIVIYGTSGWCVCQQQVGGEVGNRIVAHSQTNQVSTTFGGFAIERGKWYWVTLYRNALQSQCSVMFQDPANGYALVGQATSPMNGQPHAEILNSWDVQIGNDSSTGATGDFMEWDNVVLDWTSLDYPLFGSPASATLSGSATLGGNVRMK